MLNNMSKLSGSRQQIRIQRMWKSHYGQVKRYRTQPMRRVMYRAHWLRWSKIEGKIEAKR
jgi:hypothetical protein